MSFGFGVGDFLAVINLAKKIRKEFIDAPSQFKEISEEVRSLSIVLQDVEIVLSTDLDTQQTNDLREIVDGCFNVLKELEQVLEKYGELKPGQKGVGNRVKRTWKKLKWEPEDIKEIRSRIIARVTFLNAFQGRLASQITLATKDAVDRLHERQDDQEYREERQTILDWLTPVNYALVQQDFLTRRQEGTGQWLLDSAEFHAWLEAEADKQILFCPGIPGAGKTMLSSIVVDYLNTKFENDSSVGVAYLYCNYKRGHEQKFDDLLLNLLKQLAQRRRVIPSGLRALYDKYQGRSDRPSSDDVLEALKSVISGFSKVFFIIDALDECQVKDECQTKFIAKLLDLQSNHGASIFATSRFIPEITTAFRSVPSLEIRASPEDVRRYLDGHMTRLPKCVAKSLELQEKIKSTIIKTVDGMFLLAQLHLDSLRDKTTPRVITRALEALPNGSQALDRAYDEAAQRIQGQEAGFKELAWRVISWITCAKRPLLSVELQHALAVEVSDSELGEDNLQDIEEMVSLCAGLVTVDEESTIIRLVHYTTQEFFERTQNRWFPDAETEITAVCITYLSFDTFSSGCCLTYEALQERLQRNPLYEYATENWGHHALVASKAAKHLVLSFLNSEILVSASTQVVRGWDWFFPSPENKLATNQWHMSGVHLAASFGLKEEMEALLHAGHDLNARDSVNMTPLLLSAQCGQVAIVKSLLEHGSDIETKLTNSRLASTPLLLASRCGHEAVVKLLVQQGAKIDVQDGGGRTPLMRAISNEHQAVAKFLIQHGAELNMRDNIGHTALIQAIYRRNVAIVKLLLQNGVALEVNDDIGYKSLFAAVWSRNLAIVKLLLEQGAQVDVKNNLGQTPLWIASKLKYWDIFILISKHGADLMIKDHSGQRMEWIAVQKGNEIVIERLAPEENTEVEVVDEYYNE